MKKLLLATIFVAFGFICFGQKLVKNEVDEFTGKSVKETNVGKWIWGGGDMYTYKLYSWNDKCQITLKIVDGKTVESANKEDLLYLKFEDGKIIELNNSSYSVSCRGCGAFTLACSECMGIELNYTFDKSLIPELTKSSLVKIRVVINSKYYEKDIQKNRATQFTEYLRLIKG